VPGRHRQLKPDLLSSVHVELKRGPVELTSHKGASGAYKPEEELLLFFPNQASPLKVQALPPLVASLFR
jgi:hypothetical protein